MEDTGRGVMYHQQREKETGGGMGCRLKKGIGQMQKASSGNKEPAKRREREEANRERLLLGFHIFHEEVWEVGS